MSSVEVKMNDGALKSFVQRVVSRGLSKMAFRLRQSAIDSIDTASGPANPGEPPHTRRGQLRKAIAYSIDRPNGEAIVGPMASVVGQSGAAHEFGQEFRGTEYHERPFMRPALEENINDFSEQFRD